MKLTDIEVGDVVRLKSSDKSPGPIGVVVEIKSSRAPGDPLGFISVLSEGVLQHCLAGGLTIVVKGNKD